MAIRRALGDTTEPRHYIKTVSRQGFQFLVPATEAVTSKTDAPKEQVTATQPVVNPVVLPLSNLGQWHAPVASGLYALLFVVAFFLEVAYQFDRYGATAAKLAGPVFVWQFATTLAGLKLCQRLTLRGKTNGLLVALLCVLGAALGLYALTGWVLPSHPVTESALQAQTAQGAYLKNIFYFLPLGVVLLVLPWHFVAALQAELQQGRYASVAALLNGTGPAPRAAVYLRPYVLLALLAGALAVSLLMTNNLFDHLRVSAYTNLFTNLVWWRFALYFGLGVECLAWYYATLNDIREQLSSIRQPGTPVASPSETATA